jgi:CRISP-associated protein Cas1
MAARRAAHAGKLAPSLQYQGISGPFEAEDDADDVAWATRSNMWRTRAEKASVRRTKRAKAAPALTLAGYGVSMRIVGGALTIQNGFTHYPQKRETIRFFKGDLSLPERIILLDGSGSVTFDVLSWVTEQKVALIRIDWKGDIVCVAGASGYSANPFRVRWQLETRENPDQRNEFCRSLIARKIEASVITLEKSIRRSDKWERAMKSAYAALSRLDENPPENVIELRALEANCAASYFRSWGGIPIKWRGISRRPIPDDWHFIGHRSSPYHLAGNRNAAHPVNAILNYAYAALESEIRINAISEGYDPTIGIMHEGSDGSSKFIFDLMEPERPRIDRAVLDFVNATVFDPADFVIRADGVCRLNPEMSRMVMTKVSRARRSGV